jgi:hypothetical protein
MNRALIVLMAGVWCAGALAQNRAPTTMRAVQPAARSIGHGSAVPFFNGSRFAAPYYYGGGYYSGYSYPYSGYTPYGSLEVNAYPLPYTVGRGEWRPENQPYAPAGAASWNWSRVDLPSLVATVRANRSN